MIGLDFFQTSIHLNVSTVRQLSIFFLLRHMGRYNKFTLFTLFDMLVKARVAWALYGSLYPQLFITLLHASPAESGGFQTPHWSVWLIARWPYAHTKRLCFGQWLFMWTDTNAAWELLVLRVWLAWSGCLMVYFGFSLLSCWPKHCGSLNHVLYVYLCLGEETNLSVIVL